MTKTADQTTINAGQTAGFVVTITNNGNAAATGLTLSDPLPPGAGNDVNWKIDTTANTGNFAPGDFTITGSPPSQSLTLASAFNDTLAVGQTIAVHITGVTSNNDAGASTFSALGAAGSYAVLYEGTGGHNLSISNVTVNGNVGVGGTGAVQFSGPGTIAGRLDFAAANTGQYHNTNGSNVGPTSVNYSVAAVTNALNTVNSLSSSLAGLGNSLAINGSQTINESAGQLDTVNGVAYRVFNVTSYSETDGQLVTINGDGSGDPVVFNFGFSSNVNLGGDVALTGGLTDDDVLWNFTTTGKNISLNNNASSYPLPLAFHGDILAPNDAISLVNANLDGRVFGGGSFDMQIVSGDTINAPATTGTLPNTATVGATGDTGQPGEQASATVTVLSSFTNTTPKAGQISGTKFLDNTGNGFSADDTTTLANVEIELFMDQNGDGVLTSADGGPVATTTTASNGTYSFGGLQPGTYFVTEVVPTGYTQTGPTTLQSNVTMINGVGVYTEVVGAGQSTTGVNFDDFLDCCSASDVENDYFLVSNGATTTQVTDLRGNTSQGDTVTATFTYDGTLPNQPFSLVSYIAPGSSFNASTASQQTIYESQTILATPGQTYSISVTIPNCYYQIDFVCGYPIDHLGPANSNIFYSAQNRLISADNGGTMACGAGTGTISGTKFKDITGDGFSSDDTGLGGVTINL